MCTQILIRTHEVDGADSVVVEIIPKGFIKGLKNIEISEQVGNIQTTPLLRLAGIPTRLLET